jgi:hypothetical protein
MASNRCGMAPDWSGASFSLRACSSVEPARWGVVRLFDSLRPGFASDHDRWPARHRRTVSHRHHEPREPPPRSRLPTCPFQVSISSSGVHITTGR